MPRSDPSIWTETVVGKCGHLCDAWPLVRLAGMPRSVSSHVFCDVCAKERSEAFVLVNFIPRPEVVAAKKARKVAAARAAPKKRVKKPIVNGWLNL